MKYNEITDFDHVGILWSDGEKAAVIPSLRHKNQYESTINKDLSPIKSAWSRPSIKDYVHEALLDRQVKAYRFDSEMQLKDWMQKQ